MTDKPISVTEALALAEAGGPEWDALLARMESPKPWKHEWRPFPVGKYWYCEKCERTGPRKEDLLIDDCPIPDQVSEKLPCIVDRKMRETAERGHWGKFISCVRYVTEGAVHWRDFIRLTPAIQLICLWLAEGRLEK